MPRQEAPRSHLMMGPHGKRGLEVRFALTTSIALHPTSAGEQANAGRDTSLAVPYPSDFLSHSVVQQGTTAIDFSDPRTLPTNEHHHGLTPDHSRVDRLDQRGQQG